MLYAAERATKNHGVGGTAHISVIRDKSIITPSENNSHLAGEIVLATRRGYLLQEFMTEAIDSLIYKDGDAMKWNRRMWEEAGDRQEDLSLMLRKYRF
jgi:hypothetical protein